MLKKGVGNDQHDIINYQFFMVIFIQWHPVTDQAFSREQRVMEAMQVFIGILSGWSN